MTVRRIALPVLLCSALAFSGCGRPAQQSSEPALLFGRTGVGPLEFSYPRAAAFDGHLGLVVVDKSGRVQRIAPDGTFLTHWRTPAVEAGKPVGLTVAPDGRVFVADTHYHRVLVYSADGRLLTQLGSLGDGPSEFRLVTDVAVDSDGFVYVGEYGGNDRVSKFTARLEYLFSFGLPSESDPGLNRPQGLLIAPDDTLWVADAVNHRVVHFDGSGRCLGVFGKLGGKLGELRYPYGIDRLSDGSLVVCEYGNNRVQRFDPGGQSLGVWGSAGREPGQLAYPWALAVGKDDHVYIVDSGNNRVQVIEGGVRSTWRLH